MARYRTIHVQIWNDAEFASASDDLKLVFLNMLTTPMSTPFGAFKASKAAMADELDWPLERYSKAFSEGLPKGFYEYDESARFLYLPAFLKYNKPSNPNVLIGWGKIYQELPECALKVKLWESLNATINRKVKGFAKAFDEGFAKAFVGDELKPLAKPLAKGSRPGTGTVPVTVSETGTEDGGENPAKAKPETGHEPQTIKADQHRYETPKPGGNEKPEQFEGAAIVQAEGWIPGKLDYDAIHIMGIAKEKADQWTPAFRQYIEECRLKGRPLTVATVGKSFRRFCQNQRPEDMKADQAMNEAKPEKRRPSEQTVIVECDDCGQPKTSNTHLVLCEGANEEILSPQDRFMLGSFRETREMRMAKT